MEEKLNELHIFIEWWNELDDDSDDKFYMTNDTITRFKNRPK